ncbi:N-acetylmuramoyl-L-alanine amidase, partial [Bacillus cytotoxicus]
MKRGMKWSFSIAVTFILVLSIATSTFADRVLIIPDLPKIPYRNGVGAYEGVVA